jgi:hypothetical protein
MTTKTKGVECAKPDGSQSSSVQDQIPPSLVQGEVATASRPILTHASPLLQQGDHIPRLGDRVPLPDLEGTRLTSPIPGKCLVHSKA